MQRRRKPSGKFYPTPADTRRVTVEQIATEIDRDPAWVRARIASNFSILDPHPQRQKGRVTYDARVIELLKGLLGQPHRSLAPPGKDWLAMYEKGKHERDRT